MRVQCNAAVAAWEEDVIFSLSKFSYRHNFHRRIFAGKFSNENFRVITIFADEFSLTSFSAKANFRIRIFTGEFSHEVKFFVRNFPRRGGEY